MSALLQNWLSLGYANGSSAPDHIHNGIPFEVDGRLAVDDMGAIDHYHQGLPFSAVGRLVIDTASLPVYFGSGAAPFSADGRLTMTSGTPTHYSGGVGYDDDGRVVAIFNPSDLFAPTDNGAFYDPFVLESMYQESTGIAPVENYGDPVGLRLDTRFNLARGEEAWSNPPDNVGSQWTDNGNGTYTANGTGAGGITTNQAFPEGATLEFGFTISGATGGNCEPSLAGASNGIPVGSNGTHREIVRADSAVTAVGIRSLSAAFDGTISNVSIKQIAGNHATQPVSADRPIYSRRPLTGITNLLSVIGTDSEDNQSAGYLVFNNAIRTDFETVVFDGTNNGTLAITGDFVAGETYNFMVSVKLIAGTITSNANLELRTDGSSSAFDGFQVVNQFGSSVTSDYVSYNGSFTADNTGSGRLLVRCSDAATVGITKFQWSLGAGAMPYQKVASQYDVTQAGVADVKRLVYNGINQFYEIAGSASTFKFMHDGTGGGYAGCWSVDSPDEGINKTLYGSGVSGDVRSRLYINDASGNNGVSQCIISNGSINIISAVSVNGVVERFAPQVWRQSYVSQSGLDAFILLDSLLVASSSETSSPSSSGATNDIQIGSTPVIGDFFKGEDTGMLFISRVLTDAEGSNTDQFFGGRSGAVIS